MPLIGDRFLNLVDVMKRTQDGKQIATVIELLAQTNSILEDYWAVECNMGAIHRHSVRTGLPSVAWGRLYQGTPQSKSTTQQVDDTTGFLEALSTIDTRLLDLSPGKEGAIRLSESLAFYESLNQEMATGTFYHDTATTPERFKGLAARYNTVNTAAAPIASQVIDAGGTGSANTSVWFVTWGDNYTHGLYPAGTKAGVDRKDMGVQRVLDGSGNPYYVKEERYTWHLGIAVKDWRYNARIANIDVANLQAGSVQLYNFMRRAYYRLQSRRVMGGRQAIYCNRDVLEALDRLSTNSGSTDNFTRLKWGEVEGKDVLTYRGIPIRETDAILNTEARVV